MIWSPKDISTVEDDENSTTFAYIGLAGTEMNNSSIILQRVKVGSVVEVQQAMMFVVSGRMSYR